MGPRSLMSLAATVLAISVYYSIRVSKVDLPLVLGGHCDGKFARLAYIFRSQLESGNERGAMFSVYYRGKPVVDLWGGYANCDWEQPWKNDTLSQAFSVTKAIAAILVAKMVEKGYLDYKKPVSFYWPEFAQNGKESITVEMLLSHQAGLITLPESIPMSLLNTDTQKLESLLVEQKPLWEPGSAVGYHTITFGLYVDRLIEKADPKNRTIDRIFAEEVANPFGIDFYIGAPRSVNYRIATTTELPMTTSLLAAVKYSKLLPFVKKLLCNSEDFYEKSLQVFPRVQQINLLNNPDVRRIPCSSLSGFGSARSLAKLYGILANGGEHNGQRLLSEEMINNLQTSLVSGTDLVLGIPANMGPGVFISQKNPLGGKVFGHPGFGGQFAGGDLKHRLGFAYITNHLNVFFVVDDPREAIFRDALYEIVSDIDSNEKLRELESGSG